MNNGECLIDALRNKTEPEARQIINESRVGFSQYCGATGCEHIRSRIENSQDGRCARGLTLSGLVVVDEESLRPYERELLRIDD